MVELSYNVMKVTEYFVSLKPWRIMLWSAVTTVDHSKSDCIGKVSHKQMSL